MLFPFARGGGNFTAHRARMAIERIPDPYRRPTFPLGPRTAVLIGICVAVAFYSQLGKNIPRIERLLISAGAEENGPLLPEVADGEFWRLLTPIFLHFGIMHLVFNMLWLKDLGTAIEKLASTWVLLGLVIISGVLSNLGQFIASGPFFGGMSGVVYALVGYVWMKSRFEPTSGFHLEKQTVVMMIGWFFLCMTGAVGPVANYAHGFGLGIGVVWGFISAKMRRSGAGKLRFEE
jgi:membrane associated rhomboid family serine protease